MIWTAVAIPQSRERHRFGKERYHTIPTSFALRKRRRRCALPAHSKTLRAIRWSPSNAPASWTAVVLHRFSLLRGDTALRSTNRSCLHTATSTRTPRSILPTVARFPRPMFWTAVAIPQSRERHRFGNERRKEFDHATFCESAVAALLCRRTPRRCRDCRSLISSPARSNSTRGRATC